jgi:hypothetical protein
MISSTAISSLFLVSFCLIGRSQAFLSPFAHSIHAHWSSPTKFWKTFTFAGDKNAPELNYTQLAADFFSDPYFYRGNDEVARATATEREELFGVKTVQEVLHLVETRDVDVNACFMDSAALQPYAAMKPLEDRLHQQIVCVTDFNEVERLTERFVPLWSSSGLVNVTVSPQGILGKRAEQLCFVLGPSGSGKTFFALKYAATYGLHQAGLKYATVYLQHICQSFQLARTPRRWWNRLKER